MRQSGAFELVMRRTHEWAHPSDRRGREIHPNFHAPPRHTANNFCRTVFAPSRNTTEAVCPTPEHRNASPENRRSFRPVRACTVRMAIAERAHFCDASSPCASFGALDRCRRRETAGAVGRDLLLLHGLYYRNGSASSTKLPRVLSRVAGSGPRPSAKANSSVRRPCSRPGRPTFPSMQRGS
jgi:hypothetical protein